MDDELTNDDHLRALAALEAVVQNDDGALEILAGGALERPLAALLAAYGKHTLERVLLSAFDIEATMTHDETGQRVAELNSDPMARIVFLLLFTVRIVQPVALGATGAGLVTFRRHGRCAPLP
ncbi:hypothetical protein [Streptomyces rochei]|uniref:hypothetical protein n=1 Tax=Streptomyces rochei TaxID=1928 RepID=UPI00339F9F1B